MNEKKSLPAMIISPCPWCGSDQIWLVPDKGEKRTTYCKTIFGGGCRRPVVIETNHEGNDLKLLKGKVL